MMRRLYRNVLRLHPAAFRERFAEEMLEIFDQSEGGAASLLLFDGLASLVRQWVLRNNAWRVLLAASGALLELSAVALLWWRAGR